MSFLSFFFCKFVFAFVKKKNSSLGCNDACSYFLNVGGWFGSVVRGRVGTILLYFWFQPSAELMFFWHTTAVECYCPIASVISPHPIPQSTEGQTGLSGKMYDHPAFLTVAESADEDPSDFLQSKYC